MIEQTDKLRFKEICNVSEVFTRRDKKSESGKKKQGLTILEKNLECSILHIEVEQCYSCGNVLVQSVFPCVRNYKEQRQSK